MSTEINYGLINIFSQTVLLGWDTSAKAKFTYEELQMVCFQSLGKYLNIETYCGILSPEELHSLSGFHGCLKCVVS